MRPVARLARALLAAFWTAADHETDTDRGFIERAEVILDSEERRRLVEADTPRTRVLAAVTDERGATYAGSVADQTPAKRQARAS